MVTAAKHMGWKVLNGSPRCKRTYPAPIERIIRSGYYTTRNGKEIYVKPITRIEPSEKIVIVCDGKMVMDEGWKPEANQDPWLTKWICCECRRIEYINRAVLPLDCGGIR
jgi:hypothetical protein